MIRLMNSAMMPRPGRYDLRAVPPGRFAELVREGCRGGTLVSYIGYPHLAEFLSGWCGCHIPVSRAVTPVEDGDTLLIARLRYRIDNPATKTSARPKADDYEFYTAVFTADGDGAR